MNTRAKENHALIDTPKSFDVAGNLIDNHRTNFNDSIKDVTERVAKCLEIEENQMSGRQPRSRQDTSPGGTNSYLPLVMCFRVVLSSKILQIRPSIRIWVSLSSVSCRTVVLSFCRIAFLSTSGQRHPSVRENVVLNIGSGGDRQAGLVQ